MTVATPSAEPRPRVRSSPRAVVVADANWYTTQNLFRELDQPGVSTLLLECLDYYNAWRAGRSPWHWRSAVRHVGPRHWSRDLVLPSGWMKRFPRLGMRPIRDAIAAWRRESAADGPLTLVMTYPHYLFLRDLVGPDSQVYFNLDDYAQYWPRRAAEVDELERRAVRESGLTVCVSRLRADLLREAVPEAADRIRHLPHGTPRQFLSPEPHHEPGPLPPEIADLPRPILGYIGSLEDRVDWSLMDRLAAAFPGGSIVLVGRNKLPARAAWAQDARRCLRRPNVHALGWRPQRELARYVQSFDVCLIPYRVDHPFNRACCPTKIMDYMGSGRPIVSTSLPECSLYPHLIDLADDAGAFVEAVGSIVSQRGDDGRAADRHAWASANTCATVADRLLGWLPG